MADSNYPILVFPDSVFADREPRPGGGGKLNCPKAGVQGKRHGPILQRLLDALENRRIALQDNALGIEPELVLVIKTVGSVANFYREVEKVEGLEWLAEYEVKDIAPGDGFEDAKHPDKSLSGQLFLIMSDRRALLELSNMFKSWLDDPEAKFNPGLAPFRNLFKCLREIREWDVEDRLADTGLLDYWKKQVESGQSTVFFEAELWYRNGQSRREAASDQIRHLVGKLDGQVVTECVIEDIAYHAILGRIDVVHIRDLLNRSEAREELMLFRCDDVMFFRPTGQCAVPIGDETEEEAFIQSTGPERQIEGAPVVALLDGLPLTRHKLLDGRLVVDDPDGYEDEYQARERSHGTAMASLICHGDLDCQEAAIGRPIYVRPILLPNRGFDDQFGEMVPKDVLPVDLVHRAIVRMFSGEGGEPPASPDIRVVSLSVGDPARPFMREMSAWARLLDWLSWKYNILFVVSAGNHTQDILLEVSSTDLNRLSKTGIQQLLIQAVAEDTRNRRLLPPAETINGVTVGAIHMDKSPPKLGYLIDPLETGMPSFISAHGPGYGRAIKPEIHLPGGRQMLSEKLSPPEGTVELRVDVPGCGQGVATPGQRGALDDTRRMSGTSNAAALAARGAYFFYELLDTLRAQPGGDASGDFDAVLIKTLLVHGSHWDGMFEPYQAALRPNHNPRTFRDYVARFLGYGRPDFERVLAGTEQRVTVLGFGAIADGEAMEFAMPLPPSLSGFNGKRRFTITLAWFSPINSRRQKYRVAQLWFNSPKDVECTRSCADYHAVQRGTIQHEVFEGKNAVTVQEDEKMIIKVNCRKDADDIRYPVRFGLAVTLEIAESLLFPIPIYEEVRERISVRVRATENAMRLRSE